MRQLFIVGCPRSGTTLLQQALNRHSEIVIPPETAFCELLAGSWRRQCDHLRRINADLQISLAQPRRRIATLDEARALFKQMASLYLERLARREPAFFGDKTPQHQRRLGALGKLFPEAKMVLIHRDGRDVALSLTKLPWMSHDLYVNFARPPSFAYDRGRLARRWLPAGAKLLDVGCGPANHLRHLARKASFSVGIDVDGPTLAIARTRVESRSVSLLRYDGRRLPFTDACFDAVTTLDVLEQSRSASIKQEGAMKVYRRAVTLMELLVVVSIIGMLMALLLPAVQASREASRRNTCANSLRQVSLALLNHESAHDRFPSNGWGFRWQGDPDRGTGPDQPGSWIFNVLAYLERTDVARLGAGEPDTKKRHLLALANQVAVSVFYCPSRRAVALYPHNTVYPPHNADVAPLAGKTDYAINAGDVLIQPSWPPSYDQAANWHWADFSKATGVSYYRSTVKMADIHDGTSLTYMIGEKRVAGFGDDPGDDQGLLMGYDQDTSRWTALSLPPTPDGATPKPQRFGSAHPAVCQFIMCDGSLREIAYAIDPEIHRRLGNRLDGRVIEDTAISP